MSAIMSEARLYLVSYDIASPKRWRRVQKLIKGFCQRSQLPVFTCRATKARIERFEREMKKVLHYRDDRLGYGLLPDSLHRDVDGPNRHARWLSTDEDGDGLIDSAWVYADNPFTVGFVEALAATRFVKVGGERLLLTPELMSLAVPGGPFGAARVWQATTHYITPLRRLTKTGKERPAFSAEM